MPFPFGDPAVDKFRRYATDTGNQEKEVCNIERKRIAVAILITIMLIGAVSAAVANGPALIPGPPGPAGPPGSPGPPGPAGETPGWITVVAVLALVLSITGLAVSLLRLRPPQR